jgi:hypothetical protein
MAIRLLLFLGCLAMTTALALAEGPGTRLRTTPEVPQPSTLAAPAAKDAGISCERLRGERRARCLEELRQAGIERRVVGPEATGMGSGASSGTTSETTGGPSAGPGAPR